MRLPEFSDPRRAWLALFTLVYLIIACALGAIYGLNAFFVVMVVGSVAELIWNLRISLKRWN